MNFLRNNGLTIALLTAFLGSMVGMIYAGWSHENQELIRHHLAPLEFEQYLTTDSFWSALFENWESEWLQMAAYVVLTAYLFQKGSSESRDPDDDVKDNDPPSRAGWLYGHSLGLTLGSLFVLSFVGHFFASHSAANSDAISHGEEVVSALAYLGNAGFWFESFQNWQSEFFSTATLVVLSIFLRYSGSPESKPVEAPNDQTGD
ncbi:hypothetical protein GF108_20975 [Phyllobacterium sp. SYP-B3895]|uniref:DUF6766 family protein n=1 Tax=Phyllobacterium sp. SYP-B3895 TaxID=2663240 RepID=UPI001299B39E|nr:DUF6766 family protein [Phyllobacterium sp. SYP-B3895]MRG58043.1 hypothetical protein [Phyllobacterium sp. SYP-B3895]